MLRWLFDNWYKSTPFLALYMLIMLLLFVYDSNFPLFLIWIQFVVYLIHQFEEYILPGEFIKFFNFKILKSNQYNFPLDKQASFWINIPIVFIAFPLSAILAGYLNLSIGIWTVYFSIINAASHVGMSFKYNYNPGLLVSILLNIPIGIYTLYYFNSNKIVHLNDNLIGLFIGLLVQIIVMIYGFKVLKPRVKNKKIT